MLKGWEEVVGSMMLWEPGKEKSLAGIIGCNEWQEQGGEDWSMFIPSVGY